jgi:hypothetical protein
MFLFLLWAINFEFQIFPLLVPEMLTLFRLSAYIWLVSFDLMVLNILLQTMRYAALIHNNLYSFWQKFYILTVSQVLLISTSSSIFSKAANLFQISTSNLYLINFLRLNLSISIKFLRCLLTVSNSIISATTRWNSVSQSAPLEVQTSSSNSLYVPQSYHSHFHKKMYILWLVQCRPYSNWPPALPLNLTYTCYFSCNCCQWTCPIEAPYTPWTDKLGHIRFHMHICRIHMWHKIIFRYNPGVGSSVESSTVNPTSHIWKHALPHTPCHLLTKF